MSLWHTCTFPHTRRQYFYLLQSLSRTRGQPLLPLRSMSICSHNMSPMNGGALLRKSAFSSAQRSWPGMRRLDTETPSRLNSLIAHRTHATTWHSVHCVGSVQIEKKKKKKMKMNALFWFGFGFVMREILNPFPDKRHG